MIKKNKKINMIKLLQNHYRIYNVVYSINVEEFMYSFLRNEVGYAYGCIKRIYLLV